MRSITFIYLAGAWALAMLPGCTEHEHTKLGTGVISPSAADTTGWPASFGVGKPASDADIALLDRDVRPDGKGLPEGAGTVPAGRALYAVKCAACHGATGREGPQASLVGAMGDTARARTIGNYWPYATTLFDYIRRAMPYNAPGSLTDEEVYTLTAFLLSANRIIDSTANLDAAALTRVRMPAQPQFIPDDRHGGAEVR